MIVMTYSLRCDAPIAPQCERLAPAGDSPAAARLLAESLGWGRILVGPDEHERVRTVDSCPACLAVRGTVPGPRQAPARHVAPQLDHDLSARLARLAALYPGPRRDLDPPDVQADIDARNAQRNDRLSGPYSAQDDPAPPAGGNTPTPAGSGDAGRPDGGDPTHSTPSNGA